MSLAMAPSFSPSKSKTPVSHRKRSQHPTPPPRPPPFDLMHCIPDPDDSDDESEADIPERSPKRRKADGPAFTHTTSMNRSPSANRTPNRHGFKAVNGVNPHDTDSDDEMDEDASSSDEKTYRAIPVSTPKFNSNNIRLTKQDYDISEGESSEGLDFSQKTKAKNTPKSSRFEYDDASDLSSGEETSIPDTVSRSKSNGSRDSQKVTARAVSEIEETDSDDDLGKRSYKAVRSSRVGMPPPSNQPSSYGDKRRNLKARKEQTNTRNDESTKSSEESTDQSSRSDSEEGSPVPAPPEEELSEESSSERARRSLSEEVPAAARKTAVLDPGAEGLSNESKEGTTTGSGEEIAAEESDERESSEESEGPRVDSDSDEDAPLPQATPAALHEEAKSQSQRKKKRPRSTSAGESSPVQRVRNTKDAPSSQAKQGPARLGRLAAREDQILNDTIERFLSEHDLTEEDVPSLVKGEIKDKTALDEFWKAVYNSFPNRSSRYVRAIVKRKHTKYSPRGTWSNEEDAQLKELAEKHQGDTKRWLTIGKILDRTPVECRDRHRNYALCGSERKIGPWKAKDIRWLLDMVSKFIPEDEDKGDFPDKTEYKIDWLEVSAGMQGRRSRQQCLAKWKKMDVNPSRLRVRQLLHGRGPKMSPELRIVLMQVYSTPEDKLMRFLKAVSVYEVVVDLPIPWRKLEEGRLTRELRVETLNIIWVRLRRGLGREVEGKSDQDAARSIYAMAVEEPGCLRREVERQDEDVGYEEDIVKKPWKGLSTRISSRRGE